LFFFIFFIKICTISVNKRLPLAKIPFSGSGLKSKMGLKPKAGYHREYENFCHLWTILKAGLQECADG